MRITSPAFQDQAAMPPAHTCLGENISPPLQFGSIPARARSLVLIVEDRDAPRPWVHWLVFDIPPSTTSVPAGKIPADGTEGRSNGGTQGYEGPCPQCFSGTHRYHFQLFALDIMLGLPEDSDRARVRAAMQDHVIDYAALVGLQEGTKAAETKVAAGVAHAQIAGADAIGAESMEAKTADT